MSTTRNWRRLPVALLTTALLAIGGVGLPVGTAAAADAPVAAPAAAGVATAAGRLAAAGIAPAAAPQSSGKDFWLTFQRNASSSETTSLYLTGATATTGNVSWAGTDAAFTITPGQVTEVDAPAEYNTAVINEVTDGTRSTLGVHVTAADPVTVYGLNYAAGSSDAFLGIPTLGLGTRYRAISAPQTNNGVRTAFGPSRILVVGTVNGTTVSITPAGAIGSRAAGTTYTVSLDQGDVYTVATASTTAPANNVTGTLITADNPVAVFAGVDNATRPVGNATQDQQTQELAPTTEWGTDFLASRFRSGTAGTSFTVVADTDNTNVTVNGTAISVLNAGDSYSTTVANSGNTAVVIASDNPVEVEQYMVNNSYDPGGSVEPVTGDPSAMLLPPVTQWLSSYTFATPASGFAFNAVNIVAPQSETNAVSLDGSAISSEDFSDIPNTTDAVAQELLSTGTHTLSASDPFGIYVYGANNANSYAYPGGSGFSTGEPDLTPQTITFTGPADTLLADDTVDVSATADSGLTVTFSSATPSVCTVSGTTVTLVDHGTCTIDADQAGDETYDAAPTVSQSFTVTEPQTISFPQPADADLADGTATLSATADGGTVTFTSSTPSVCTVSGSTLTLVTAGTCTIAADQAGGDGVQAGPTVTRSFTVLADQTISFTGPADTPLADGTVSVSATSDSSLPVSFSSATPSVCTVAGAMVTLVDHGTCTIVAHQAGNGSYAAAPTVSQSFTVTQPQTISFPQPADADLADGTVTLSASAPGGDVTFTSSTPSVCTVSGTTVTLVTAGTCTIAADQAGGDGVQAAPTVTRSFTVLADQTITFNGPDDTDLAAGTVAVSATSDSALPVAFSSESPSICTVSGTTVTLVSSGTCIIDADQAGNSTYAPASTVTQSFYVLADQTIDFPQPAVADLADGSVDLTASAPGGDVTFTSSTPGVCTVSGTTVTLVAAGTCTIAAHQGGNEETAPAPTVSRSFTVLADQTISFTGPADTDLATGTISVYATADSGLPVSFSSAAPAVCTVSGTTVTLLGSGTCTIDADQSGNAGTAAAPTVFRSFYVLADQEIDFLGPDDTPLSDGTVTVSATAPGGTVTFSSATPSVCTVSGTTVTLLTAGTCSIAAYQTGTGQTAPAPTVTRSFQVRGAQSISFTAPADTALAIGTVDLTASAPGGDVMFTTSTPEVCRVRGTTVTLLGHGTCSVTAHQAGDDTHLAAPPVTHSFTVTEPQSISFPQPADVALSSGTVDVAASAPGGDVTFASVTSEVCTVSGNTVTLLSNGTCTITADQSGGDGILPAESVSRSFQVKTVQTITFVQPADSALGSGPVTLSASSSAGLPITFTSATPAVCTVSGATVTLITTGTCTIAADDAGSASYLAAPTVMRSFVVNPAPAAPVVVTGPTSVSVRPGATATFVAAATGYPTPTVQWQVLAPGGRWRNIPGATAPTYTTGPLRSAQSGTRYRAVFTNVNGTVVTAAAVATVSAPPVPAPLVLVSQTLWGHIEIAAHSTRIPFTIRFNQSRPALSVVLTNDRTHAVLASTTIRPARAGTSFSGSVGFGLGAIHGYGSYTWTLTTLGGGPKGTFVLRTDLRQHSTLALHAKRKGARVTLTGAAQVFSVAQNRYRPWAGQVVLIQKETRDGWVTIVRTRTDGHGRIDARLHLPQHLMLRLVDLDTPNQWGRTSNTATT